MTSHCSVRWRIQIPLKETIKRKLLYSVTHHNIEVKDAETASVGITMWEPHKAYCALMSIHRPVQPIRLGRPVKLG